MRRERRRPEYFVPVADSPGEITSEFSSSINRSELASHLLNLHLQRVNLHERGLSKSLLGRECTYGYTSGRFIHAEVKSMKFVMPGGSGQVGSLLARALSADGHEVVVLSRHPKQAP